MITKLKLTRRYPVALAVLVITSPAFAQAYSSGYGFTGVALIGWAISTTKWLMALVPSGPKLVLQQCQHCS